VAKEVEAKLGWSCVEVAPKAEPREQMGGKQAGKISARANRKLD